MKRDNLIANWKPEDLADSFVFPSELSKDEKEEADLELALARRKRRGEITEHESRLLRLMQLRYRLENYIQKEPYDSKYRFSYFLREYLNIVDKKRRDFAEEIDIHETLVSQLINNHREPNESIMVRLEIHSANIIPAIHWLKVVEKGREHHIRTSKELRRKESRFVRKKLEVKSK